MVSLSTDISVSDEALAKSAELKCLSCHSCPPSGSADRFKEIANLVVNMGVML